MKFRYHIAASAASVLLLMNTSCQQSGSKEGTKDSTATAPVPMAPVALTPVTGSPEFPGAELAIQSVKAAPNATKDSATVSFEFAVKNYKLTEQTPDAANKQCNNSDKGQHIHFIMDNGPYAALYAPKQQITLANNTEHYLMCFLSRSYHESIKSKGAAVVYHFKIDEKGNLKKLDDPKEPMLFYSRPKGDYVGKDTANLLLDFYVWNATLGSDYKVKAEIANESNGQKKEELISTWQPMFIQNLGTGKAHVTLTLVDKDGKTVNSPMAQVTRNFQLAAQEPLK